MNHTSPRSEIRSAIERLRLVPQTVQLVWSAAPLWCVLWAALLGLQGIVPAVVVYLTRPLTDALVLATQSGFAAGPVRDLVTLACVYGVVLWGSELVASALSGVRSVQAELVEDYVTDRIHLHAMEADLAFYESPDYYDLLQRAREQASTRSLSLLENVGEVIQGGIALLSIAAILLTYGALIALLLLLSAVPAALVLVRQQWLTHQWWMETTTERRWTGYYDGYLTSVWAAEEQRLFGWGSEFRRAYRELRQGLRERHFRLIRRQAVTQALAGSAALVVAGAAAGWMVWRISLGEATLGDLARFYAAFNFGQSRIRALLTGAAQIFSNLLFVASLYEVLGLRPRVKSPDHPLPTPGQLKQGIRFRGVSFRYPGSERRVLDGFNLFIPAGRTVAIVGPNGAGKTTLTKLLCRFYDPEEGRVEIDGVDIRSYALEDLRDLITVLFQSPVSYAAPVEYNIGVGNLRSSQDPDSIADAAKAAGAHEFISELPGGYKTMLGKIFPGGVNLSGGESQRVALARAFFRDSPIVVLDEPTSSMDSWAEIEWHTRFRRLVRGKTVLIITHRFTTAMRADHIFVMQDGAVAEEGSHGELVAQGGLYAKSWLAQISETGSGSHRVNTAPHGTI